MKINAAARLRAGLQERIEDIRHQLGVDGYCIQHSNQSIMFQFYVHPPLEYLARLKKKFDPPKVGNANGEAIYRWDLRSVGVALYWPTDTNKAVRIQMYNRDEQYATILAYDNTWVKKMEQKKSTKQPKYVGQKPSQLKDEHIFTLEPSALAQRLKNLYKDDYAGAMGSLTMYKNRAGKNLPSPDRDRLEKAKDQLRKLYGKDDEDTSSKSPDGAQPANSRKPADVGKRGTGGDKSSGSGKDQPIGSRPTTRTV